MNKPLKVTLITISSLLGAAVLFVGGYVGYVLLSYNRLGDMKLSVNSESKIEKLDSAKTYKMATYNIGFGAYSQDFTFFLDTGYDENGKETCGYYSTAKSKDEVLFNTNGALNTIKNLDVDFALFQEVDTDSTRSYHVNEHTILQEGFEGYDDVHCINYHSAFLAYPLYDFHGASNAGLSTFSRYQIKDAERKEYTVSTSLSKLFDLDRCFSYSVMEMDNGKNFYLINSHMSAYDSGGTIRQTQMKELNAFLHEVKEQGDYCIVGGDFNNDLITYNPDFDYNETDKRAFQMTKKSPDWLSFFYVEDGSYLIPLEEGYSVVASDNLPTCRNNDMEWKEGETFVCTIDGFIVSDNIKVTKHENILTTNEKTGVTGFAYSDHQPAYMEFEFE